MAPTTNCINHPGEPATWTRATAQGKTRICNECAVNESSNAYVLTPGVTA